MVFGVWCMGLLTAQRLLHRPKFERGPVRGEAHLVEVG